MVCLDTLPVSAFIHQLNVTLGCGCGLPKNHGMAWHGTPVNLATSFNILMWSLPSHFGTGQGPVLQRWRLDKSVTCECGQQQIMNHTVDTSQLTQLIGRLQLLQNQG